MSRVVVEFETGNEAFRLPDGRLDTAEVRAVLVQVAERIDEDGRTVSGSRLGSGWLFDSNGNTVGTYDVEEDTG